MPPAKKGRAGRSMADLARQVHQAEDASPAIVASDNGSLTVVPPKGRRSGIADIYEPDAAAEVPEPYESTAVGPLDDREREHLAACETALNVLRVAFARAGKALQTIHDARLYREDGKTFEEYCEARWQMSRAYAYRLIQAWPIAEALSPIGDTVNEAQVRPLVPLAARHGSDAAVMVYRELAEAPGVRVTGDLIRSVVAVLPVDRWDPAAVADQIRAYLAGELALEPAADADPVEVWRVEAERLQATVRKVVTRSSWRSAAREHPDQARAVIAELRELLDQAERDAQG